MMEHKQSLSKMAFRRKIIKIQLPQELKAGGFCDIHCERKTKVFQFSGILIICLLSVVNAAGSKCSFGLNTPGTTYPSGDILLLHGESLKILCLLDAEYLRSGLNSSNLVFYQGSDKIEREFITVVNETTIQLHIRKPPLSDTMFYCKLHTIENKEELAVCLNNVVVGTSPQTVEGFNCLSLNWQNLTCKWKPPHNYLKTTYALTYKLSTGRGMYECPNITVNQSNGIHSCFWDQSTLPPYRQAHENYTFRLTGSNKFGSLTQEEFFHHYAWVKPSPPIIEKINKTTSSIFLKWKVPPEMQNFPPGFVHKVIYQSQYDVADGRWHLANFSDFPTRKATILYNLTNLEYAYTMYDVRVYLKSGRAVNDDLWSDFGAYYFQTMSKAPSRPPVTQIGSFEVKGPNENNRKLYLYWKQIKEHEQNGKNFTYRIVKVEVDGHRNNSILPHEVTFGYAVFENAPLKSLNFTIASSNVEGESENKSFLYVPDQMKMVPQPPAFTKIAFGNGLYELSWRAPGDLHGYDIDSYTIFWCDNERGDRPHQCEGHLNSTTVNSSVTILNVTVADDKIFQFAISANSGQFSSGMVWADCTVIPSKIVGKMKMVWINKVGPTFIELAWRFDCSERIGIIQGYRVFYCPIDSPQNGGCKGPDENVTISAESLSGNVTNLKPYTTYRLRIGVVTMHGDGLQSDPLFNTTLEAAPSQPVNVTVTDITNTNMHVFWDPPKFINGVLRYYRVNYNMEFVTIDKIDLLDVNDKMAVILTNLTSYTNYTVTIQACSISCSLPSGAVVVRTAIGIPGLMDKPKVQPYNSSAQRVLLTWNPPFYPGGTLDIYEIQVVQSSDDGRNVTMIYNTTALEFVVPAAVCREEGIFTYMYSVRAVNYDWAIDHGAAVFTDQDSVKLTKRLAEDNSILKYVGSWSQAADNICYTNQANNTVMFWVVGTISIIIFCALFMFGSKRLWSQYKTMQDIGVHLPPGLEPNTEIEPTKYPLGNWGSPVKHIKDEKLSFTPSADEVSLLPNRTLVHDDRSGRDLSGFSINTGTTNLSLTSSRVPSDSNKDNPILQDGNQSEPQSTNSSLRLGNNSSGTSRPASVVSLDQNSWTSPYTRRNSTQGESIAPYTTIGIWNGDDYYTLDTKSSPKTEVPAGYVSFGKFDVDSFQDNLLNELQSPSIMNFQPINTVSNNSNGYVSIPTVLPNYTKVAPLSPAHLANNIRPNDLPIGYIKTAPENVVGLPTSNFTYVMDVNKCSPNVPLGYVRVDELPMASEPPTVCSIPATKDRHSQIVHQDNNTSNPCTSDYIKLDPIFNIDNSIEHPTEKLQSYQPISKGYVILPDTILSKQGTEMDETNTNSKVNSITSPEGYCRFGWNRNESNFHLPHDNISSVKEIGALSLVKGIGENKEQDFSSLIEDLEYDDPVEESSDIHDEVRPVNSSYLPLNLSTIRH